MARAAAASGADLIDLSATTSHILSRDLGVPVTTNYGFTSEITTLAVAAATRIPGAGALLTRVAGMSPYPTGTGPWVGATHPERRTVWATGIGQAKGTAIMAELAANHLAASDLAPGVVPLHQLMSLDTDLVAALSSRGIAVAEHAR